MGVKRRAFLKSGLAFTGLLWIPKVAHAFGFSPGILNPFWTASLIKSSASVPTWYDIEQSVNADTFPAWSGTDYVAALVTAGQSGTCTKLRVYISNNTDLSAHNVKMAIYTAGGALMSSGSVSVASSDDGVYKEVTLAVAQSVTASTQYILAGMADDNNLFYAYKAGTGALDAYIGKVYATFPYDPVGTPDFDDLARNVCFGMWIQ